MPVCLPEIDENAIEAKVKQEGRPLVNMDADEFLYTNYHLPRDRQEVDISRLKHFASQNVKARFLLAKNIMRV